LRDPEERFTGSYRLYRRDGTPLAAEDTWMALAIREGRDFLGKEIVIERPDGTRVLAIANARPVRDADGRVTGAVNVLTPSPGDEIAEAHFRALADAAPMMVWMSGPDKLCDHFNRAWLEFTGRPIEAELGNGWTEGVHPDDFARCLDMYVTRFDERRPFEMEYRLRRHDGEYRWILDSGAPRYASGGTFKGYLGSCVDIHDRKVAEESLRDRESRLRTILSSEPECVKLLDADGRLVEMNEAGLRMIEASSLEQVKGHCVYPLVCAPYRTDFEELVAAVFRGESATRTFEISGLKGRHLWVEMHAAPLRDAVGNVVQLLSVTRDVTQRKMAEDERERLEARVLHAQKLESLGVLAGGIAHDFNNLLTSMLGYASLAQRDLPSGAPARPMIREIEHAAQRAAELVRLMLAYSGRGNAIVEDIRLDLMVDDVSILMGTVISKKAELALELAEAPIRGDATQLRQVVMNLLVNASDALEGQAGKIGVRTGRVQADAALLRSRYTTEDLPEGDYAFVEVSDAGCGMNEDTLARLFDPFFTTKPAGRGLGLSAVLGIVNANRGAIRVDSQPGHGTTVTVLFPSRSAAATAVVEERRKVQPEFPGGTVLVVDDEPGVRKLARDILQSAGYAVVEAADGEEGLQNVERDRGIGLVLLDQTMPRKDGSEVLAVLRMTHPRLPVVLMTGYGAGAEAASVADGFLAKPFLPLDLLALVGRLIGRPSRNAA
jgi:PAS domain S-box-containing protein